MYVGLTVTPRDVVWSVCCSCVCLGIEVQDLFGSLGSASDRSLLRYATDSSGRVKYDKGLLRLSNSPEEMTHHVGEGCNVFGTMYVESVPGNFHVSCGKLTTALQVLNATVLGWQGAHLVVLCIFDMFLFSFFRRCRISIWPRSIHSSSSTRPTMSTTSTSVI